MNKTPTSDSTRQAVRRPLPHARPRHAEVAPLDNRRLQRAAAWQRLAILAELLNHFSTEARLALTLSPRDWQPAPDVLTLIKPHLRAGRRQIDLARYRERRGLLARLIPLLHNCCRFAGSPLATEARALLRQPIGTLPLSRWGIPSPALHTQLAEPDRLQGCQRRLDELTPALLRLLPLIEQQFTATPADIASLLEPPMRNAGG